MRTLLAAALLAAAPVAAVAQQEGLDLDAARATALELVNASRAEHDLPPLSTAPPLAEAAQAHAEDMLRRDYYAHRSPEGDTVMDRYLAAGGTTAKGVAENIARCDGCPPAVDRARLQQLHTGWMESPGHRRNILDAGKTHFGFGLAAGDGDGGEGGGGLFAVQTFAGPGETGGEELAAPELAQAAVERVNTLRQEAGTPTLEAAPDLTAALADALPAEDLGDADLQSLLADPTALVPAERRGSWRSFSVVAGRCGGCGVAATAEDVDRFVDQWLESGRYRDTLTDRRFTHLAFAVAADGSGRKVAIAILAGG